MSTPIRGGAAFAVGISGRICAGKTTASTFLTQHGFAYTRFSLAIDDEILRRGEKPDRASRQRIGMEIHETIGQEWLCRQVLNRVRPAPQIVIDGLRFREDHAFFEGEFGHAFLHVHVEASAATRRQRYSVDESDGVPFDVADSQPVEAEASLLARSAHVVLRNEGTLPQLAEKLYNALGQRA